MSLRDTLEKRLASLPNSTSLGLTVLTSSPTRTNQLFPHAPAADVKCHETEVLIVVHCGLPLNSPSASTSTSTSTPSLDSTTTPTTTGPPQALAAAISAHIYTLPTTPPSTLIYISKVDSSGYASTAGPLTRALASGLLQHYLSPSTRLGGPGARAAATLFARSQGQYLFPNSVEGGGKRVLGGLGLCQWWKSVFEEAAGLLVESGVKPDQLGLRYLLPSYSASEAKGMLGTPRRPLPPQVEWHYEPPFTEPLLASKGSLATLIPSLPDDPKTRFLEELVADSVHRHEPISPRGKSRKERDAAEVEEERRRAFVALGKIPAEEFWERIGFRQECASGDVTGFFSVSVKPEGEVGAITSSVPATANLPQSTVARVLKSMLNTDFGTRELAAAGTGQWLASTRSLVVDEVGEEAWKDCIASIPPKEEGQPALKRKEEQVVTMLQPRKKKRT